MAGFLSLLPRALTTFLFVLAALLEFYANTTAIHLPQFPLSYQQWSFWAFIAATTSLVVNLCLVNLWSFVMWQAGNQRRDREIEA